MNIPVNFPVKIPIKDYKFKIFSRFSLEMKRLLTDHKRNKTERLCQETNPGIIVM